MRHAVLTIIVVAAALATVAYLWRGSLVTRLMPFAARRNIAANIVATLPDGLHLGLCGAGSPMPDPERSGPCVAVIAGKTIFVVDAGSGGARNLLRMHLPIGGVKAVLLTHFHSDHIDGLGELGMLRWVGGGNTTPLPVYGPPGVEQIVAGFNQAYRIDAGYRTAHHGPEVAPPEGAGLEAREFGVPDDGTPTTVWDADGVRIVAFAVDHKPAIPAVGYRFDYKGRSLVLSGDTKKTASVEREAKGVDLLVHEGLAAHLVAIMNRAAKDTGAKNVERITHDIPSYHTTPVEAAHIAAEAGVKALLFDHIVPPLLVPGMEAAFLQGVGAAYHGKVVVGKDGTFVSMPSGSNAIRFSNLL
jgi:ribonuclease Z